MAPAAGRRRRARPRRERLPRARNGHHEEAERIEELLVTAQELWRDRAELVSDDERVAAFRSAIQLVNLADMVSVTTRA